MKWTQLAMGCVGFFLLGCATTASTVSVDSAVAPEAAAVEAASEAEASPAGTDDITAKTGPQLEPFQLKQANGRRYDVTPDLQANKVIMVSFWATWCGPCKAEMEKLSPVYDELLGEGFQYLAVSTDGPDSVAEVRPYIRSNDYQFPVLLDTTGKLLERYNPRGDLPYYLLVNRKGQIVEEHQGFVPGDEVGIEARVRALLKAGR